MSASDEATETWLSGLAELQTEAGTRAASRNSAEPRHPTSALSLTQSHYSQPAHSPLIVPYSHKHGRRNPISLIGCSRLALRVSDRARDCQSTPRRTVEGRIRSVRTTAHPSTARSRIQTIHHRRLGQEPPPQPTEDAFDGRSLAEVRVPLRFHSCTFRPLHCAPETRGQQSKHCANCRRHSNTLTYMRAIRLPNRRNGKSATS